MNKKIINNAIASYFLLWALLLLIRSKKENINNPFVKSHSKVAVVIHILFAITYITFIFYGFLWNVYIKWYYLNHIIAASIFIFLFWFLLYWIYKASLWEVFKEWEIKQLTKTSNIIEFKQSNLNEEWILTIILSLVPFLWFTLRWKFYNYKSPIINNNIKLNFISTLIFSILFVFWKTDIMWLFILFYIIYVVFFSLILIVEKKILNLNLSFIPTMEELYIYNLSFLSYIKNYFSGKFVWFKEIFIETKNKYQINNQKRLDSLSSLSEPKMSIIFTYIPILNIICLFDYSKNKYHILNGLIITFLTIFLILVWYYECLVFLLIIIFFNVWYSKKLNYKMFFLSDLFYVFVYIFKKIFFIWNKIKEKKSEVNEVVYKIND